MAGHKEGDTVVLTGTIVEIAGDIAIVRVDKSFPLAGVIAVRLGTLPDHAPSDEDRIRDAMASARAGLDRTITR